MCRSTAVRCVCLCMCVHTHTQRTWLFVCVHVRAFFPVCVCLRVVPACIPFYNCTNLLDSYSSALHVNCIYKEPVLHW